ncbi:MAG: phosphoribosyltransferase family protein [Flavobacteriales bacterium]
MSPQRTIVLNHQQIAQKIHRIAFEVVENNFNEEIYYIIGITGQGYTLAERLFEEIKKVSGKKAELHSITLVKDDPLNGKIEVSVATEKLAGKYVLLVDDVLNSGRTLMYAARNILEANVKKLQTVCLVDRRHRRFPIRADFAGLTLSTTLQNHILVELNGENDTAYLE